MARVRHTTRRKGATDNGYINIGGTVYFLDEDGVLDLTSEHATMVLQGAGWESVAVEAPASERDPAPVVKVQPDSDVDDEQNDGIDDLPSKTKDELLEMARTLGLDVERRNSKLHLVSVIRAALAEGATL